MPKYASAYSKLVNCTSQQWIAVTRPQQYIYKVLMRKMRITHINKKKEKFPVNLMTD